MSDPSLEQRTARAVKAHLAQDVIQELFNDKQTGWIQVLLMQCALCAKQLDPASYRKFIMHAASIIQNHRGAPSVQAGNEKL